MDLQFTLTLLGMATITRGNTQAPTIMIAERAAARIARAAGVR